MRESFETAADINFPLTPEWPSLTARARGATHQVPALDIVRKGAGSHGYQCFEVSFKDGTKTLLSIGVLKQSPHSWLIWFGNPRKYDLLSEETMADIIVEQSSTGNDKAGSKLNPKLNPKENSKENPKENPKESQEGWILRSKTESLMLSKNGGFSILNHEGGALWRSAASDLFVGDVPVSHAFFKHEHGFGISLDMGDCQTIMGGGEQFGLLNMKGRVYDVMNSDALGVNGQLRYQSTPFFITEKGHSIAMLQCEPSRIDFGSRRHDIMSFASDGEVLGLYLASNLSPAKSISAWRDLMGGVRGVPDWSFGLWLSRCFYQDEAEVREIVRLNEETKLGASVINLDARAWMRAKTRTDFVWDVSRFSPFQTFIPWLREKGFQVCLWENPYVSSATETVYADGVKKGFFAKTKSGEVYPYQWVPTGLEGFPQPPIAGLVDFTNPEARAWWKDFHRPYLRAGVNCFKTDFGEEIPSDAVFSDGSTGKQLRNVYSDLYNLCVMEVVEEECGREGILWARSGFTKMGQTPVKWAGDSQTSWNAMRSSLRGGLSQAVGGAVFWAHDIGGFYGPKPDPELYLRWSQLGLWGSHARMHGTSAREPWEFGERVLNQVKKDVALRKKLDKYFIDCAAECVKQRQSFLQPLWLYHSDDPVSWTIEDQFFAGSKDVLVAPFVHAPDTPLHTPETEKLSKDQLPSHVAMKGGRRVYLPKGHWTCLVNQKTYESGLHFLPRSEDIPVFVRKDSSWMSLFQ